MFVYGYIFSICQHKTSRLCPTNRNETSEKDSKLLNIAGNLIDLSEGQAMLVKCPGKSIDVMITGAEAGKWAVELQNSEHCSYTKTKPNCNKNMRSEDSDFDTYLKKIDPKTLEYHDLRYSNYKTTTKKMNELFIVIEDEVVWTGIEKA